MTTASLRPPSAPWTPGMALIRPLPVGALDIVGDVHGQIDALRDLMRKLGYDEKGEHREGRRLVFLGDLVDRGPDSPGVIEWVMDMVGRGTAFSILGNHELNILIGKEADHNAWFFGSAKPELAAASIGEDRRLNLLRFMKSLPLALEREDLRVVHAAWQDSAVELVREEHDALSAFKRYEHRIAEELAAAGTSDKTEMDLAHQNRNPIKMITSGPEEKVEVPFLANDKMRAAGRVPWWDEYHESAFVVFGHYWRNAPADFQKGPNLFEGYDEHHILGAGHAISIDYSVGARHRSKGVTRLAALRWPDRTLMFDDGEQKRIAIRPR